MKKSDEGSAREPYMYIVQPEISPPNSHMQSQYRTVVEQEEAADMIDGDEKESLNEDEIRIVASEVVVEPPEIIGEPANEENEVVEVSTGVTDGLDSEGPKKQKVIRKPKQQKKRKFSDMSKDELLKFLARMPAAVPKPVCTLYIGGEPITAQVVKKKGDRYILRVQLEDRSETITALSSEIDEVIVDNL